MVPALLLGLFIASWWQGWSSLQLHKDGCLASSPFWLPELAKPWIFLDCLVKIEVVVHKVSVFVGCPFASLARESRHFIDVCKFFLCTSWRFRLLVPSVSPWDIQLKENSWGRAAVSCIESMRSLVHCLSTFRVFPGFLAALSRKKRRKYVYSVFPEVWVIFKHAFVFLCNCWY